MLAPAPVNDVAADPRPRLSVLFRQIADDATLLARSEVALARAEIAQNVASLGKPVAMLGGAALLGVAALFTLMGAAVAALAPLVGAALAALIVAAVVGIVAALLAMAALNGLKAIQIAPKRAVRSVKADVAAAQQAAKDVVS